MRLVDCIAQCRTPFIVQNSSTGELTRLNGAADFAVPVQQCPIRYVLSDELTRLCTALAYSKGARQVDCTDLLRIPARSVWVEWSDVAWLRELQRYGFRPPCNDVKGMGHRGALIRATADGRSGTLRTFWTVAGADPEDVLVSSIEAHFDLDTPAGEADLMQRCFRFCYEQSWADYYRRARLSAQVQAGVANHALGTIAADIPMLLAFFLLLGTKSGLPRRLREVERLNKCRARSGKALLLEHIEVLSPVLPEHTFALGDESVGGRRAPRLHHVRGHLVRRGSELHWRVPHLRGNARAGIVRSRTVTWSVDRVN